MKKFLFFLASTTFLSMPFSYSQFNLTAGNWLVPAVENYAQDLDQVNGANYSLVDINGDGRPDLVDAQDNATSKVWLNSSNLPYWKIYLNNGTSFSATAQDWTIPAMENLAQDLDQVNGANYSLVDINGDGKPDLVDAQDNATSKVWLNSSNLPYWKVYLNTGTSFSATAQNWTIPAMENLAQDLDQVSSANYSLIDINGDGKPDLVDAQDNATSKVWLNSSNLPYWKVYLNTGTSFSATAQNWTIPAMESLAQDLDQVSGANYNLVDVNGDKLPDLVDAQDNATSKVWLNSSNQPYWKVYINNGGSFIQNAESWIIPAMENYAQDLDQVNSANYSLVDINGDGKPDLIDAQDNSTAKVWLNSSNQPYWKIYLNTSTSSYLSVDEVGDATNKLTVYPNPTEGKINIDLSLFDQNNNITVINGIGKVIYKEKTDNQKITLDLSLYEPGLYFVSVLNGNTTYTVKVIKK